MTWAALYPPPKIFTHTHKSSISSYTQEKNDKVLSRWYKTPNLLHRIYPLTPDTCWRCNESETSYLHIQWECQEVLLLWKKVFSLYNSFALSRTLCSPTIALPSLNLGPISLAKYGQLYHFKAATFQTIAAHWKRTGSPSPGTFQ